MRVGLLRQHIGADAHRVAHADAGQQRRAADQQDRVRAHRLADQAHALAICIEAVDGLGVEEVELEETKAPLNEVVQHGPQVVGRAAVGDVEDAHAHVPVHARVEALDEPLGMVARELAPRVDHEGRNPYSRDHSRGPDRLRGAAKGAETWVRLEPVADRGLEAVVDLDDLDRKIEAPGRLDILDHVRLGDLLEVVRP